MTNEQVLLGILGLIVTISLAVISFLVGKRIDRNGQGQQINGAAREIRDGFVRMEAVLEKASGGQATEFWLMELQKITMTIQSLHGALLDKIGKIAVEREDSLVSKLNSLLREARNGE